MRLPGAQAPPVVAEEKKMWLELMQANDVRIEIESKKEPVEKPTAAELDAVEGKLKIKLPADYRSFCQELGPGVMADLITIMAPCNDNDAVDLLKQVEHGRKVLKSAQEEIRPDFKLDGSNPNERRPDEFDPGKMVSFASTLDGFNFYWNLDEPTGKDEYAIYGLNDDMPPLLFRVTDSFRDFIMQAALGERLIEVGLYGRFSEPHPRVFFPATKKRGKAKKK
jgi:SMI1/KNR4 family protein SUKH-1